MKHLKSAIQALTGVTHRFTLAREPLSAVLLTALLVAYLGSSSAWGEAQVYDARVVDQKPFERRNFVQGLEIHDDLLMVSSGHYYRSALRLYDWPDMSLREDIPLPKEIFAEGLTRLGDRLYILTWRARRMLVYDAVSFEFLGNAGIPGEGWGITHHGSQIYYSDGSDRLFTVDGKAGGKLSIIKVTLNGKPLTQINELEWVDGEIWANVWQRDIIVRIDPSSGVVTGVIHLENLLADDDRDGTEDVLNGIARDPTNGDIWVTGKRWPWLFKIALENRDH